MQAGTRWSKPKAKADPTKGLRHLIHSDQRWIRLNLSGEGGIMILLDGVSVWRVPFVGLVWREVKEKPFYASFPCWPCCGWTNSCTTLKPWETTVCWYLQGGHTIPGFLRWCWILSIRGTFPMTSERAQTTNRTQQIVVVPMTADARTRSDSLRLPLTHRHPKWGESGGNSVGTLSSAPYSLANAFQIRICPVDGHRLPRLVP